MEPVGIPPINILYALFLGSGSYLWTVDTDLTVVSVDANGACAIAPINVVYPSGHVNGTKFPYFICSQAGNFTTAFQMLANQIPYGVVTPASAVTTVCVGYVIGSIG